MHPAETVAGFRCRRRRGGQRLDTRETFLGRRPSAARTSAHRRAEGALGAPVASARRGAAAETSAAAAIPLPTYFNVHSLFYSGPAPALIRLRWRLRSKRDAAAVASSSGSITSAHSRRRRRAPGAPSRTSPSRRAAGAQGVRRPLAPATRADSLAHRRRLGTSPSKPSVSPHSRHGSPTLTARKLRRLYVFLRRSVGRVLISACSFDVSRLAMSSLASGR